MSKATVGSRSAALTRRLTVKSLFFPGCARGVLLLLVAGLFGACMGVAADTVEGSQTHFLRRCSDGCGSGLSCLCGVCTRPCSETSECTDLAAAASCVDAASSCESTSSLGSSCSVECGSDADCQNLGAAFSCSGGQCQAPELRLTSLRPALGEPCVPADETFATFSGFSGFEVNVETRGSCGNSNVCLVHQFQGRVTCPSGQSGMPGDRPCATPDGVPVEVSVEPQLESRPAEQAVVCSCRCAGPTRGANYCSCPSGMRCEPLLVASEVDYEDLAGSYCVY